MSTNQEQVIRAAFEQRFNDGGYQYSQDNKDNAYGWFRTGWIIMEAHGRSPGVVADADAPTGSPEWDLAMDLYPPKLDHACEYCDPFNGQCAYNPDVK
jgi:hypothetical protein